MNPEQSLHRETQKTNRLLQSPEIILPEELKTKDQRWSPYFFSNTHGYQLIFHNGRICFKIEYANELPDELSKEEKSKFSVTKKKVGGKKIDVYTYTYGDADLDSQQTSIGFAQNYHVSKPRTLEQETVNPQKMDAKDLAEFIKAKKVVFYTGSGISAPVGLTMQKFREDVGSDMSESTDRLIKTILNNPEKIERQFQDFLKKAFESPATSAHKSLAVLAKQKDAQILTENFDFLQEQAGVKPFRVSGERLKSDIDPEWLKEIDVVICIGLRYDDRGFLGWYKQNNPAGKIISLDIYQPNYLGVDDYWVQGDVQTTLPEIENQIKKGLIDIFSV